LIRKYKIFNFILDISDGVNFLKSKNRGYFSQNGEDLFISNYFQDRQGVYVDVGANHPFKNSNTYLLHKKGWKGINIEPIPSRLEKFYKTRVSDVNLNVGVGAIPEKITFYEMSSSVLSTFSKEVCEQLVKSKEAMLFKTYDVDVVTLASVFKNHLKSNIINVLSIDTEGFEIEVLNGIDWNAIELEMIVIESSRTNSTKNEDEETKILNYLAQKNYKLIKSIGGNSIFINESNTLKTIPIGDRSN
jgi:FkbM family methyltransferase